MPAPERRGSHDSLDPIAPRPDDPWIGRWWWWRRRYQHLPERDRPAFFRWPVALTLLVIMVGIVGLVVVRLVGAA